MHWSLVQWKTFPCPYTSWLLLWMCTASRTSGFFFCCCCSLPTLHAGGTILYTHTRSACAIILYFVSLQQFIFLQGFCIKYVHISFLPVSAILSVILIACIFHLCYIVYVCFFFFTDIFLLICPSIAYVKYSVVSLHASLLPITRLDSPASSPHYGLLTSLS